jgi:corrinoid protein of di/trimethylamine methyltransferase
MEHPSITIFNMKRWILTSLVAYFYWAKRWNTMSKEQIYAGLEKAVVSGKKDEAKRVAEESLKMGVNPIDSINHGLVKGMNIVGDKYAAREYFLPQVLISADAMYGALDILLPHIPKEDTAKQIPGCIGVMEGDVHDIGKNIVKTMMTAGGFAVTDLGRDVPIEKFVDFAKAHNGGIVAMSTLMTPTMDGMKMVMDGLVESGVRMKCKTIIGGAPTSTEVADDIGADFHAINAQEGVAKLKAAF